MHCWICGGKGETGEHLIKVSDIKSVFPNITQESPILYHDDNKRNVPVGSATSDRFKSKALICAKCNNERTQPFDNAWLKLGTHLREYDLSKRGELKIRLNKVYGSNIYSNALNVHLYFVKLFGCRAVEASLPVDIQSFSSSIMDRKPHPNIFLVFKKAIGIKIDSLAVSHIEALVNETDTKAAGWVYSVGDLNVEVLYAKKPSDLVAYGYAFHPPHKHKVIRFVDYDEDDEI